MSRSKEIYRRRRESGLCGLCGKCEPTEGSACEPCKEKQREFRRRCKEKKLCCSCAKPCSTTQCKDCYNKHKKASHALYARRRNQKLCVHCAKPTDHRVYCEKCRARMRERAEERRKQNKCTLCGVNELSTNYSKCAGCLEKLRNIKNTYNAKKRLDGICIACTEKAAPGRTRCEKHLQIRRETSKRKRVK